MTTPVVLFGASGLLGGEFLRLLDTHPSLTLAAAATREGGSLAPAHPHLAQAPIAITFDLANERVLELASAGTVAIAYALPHGESARHWMALRTRLRERSLESKVVVVDLAADYRLRDPDEHHATYGEAHADPEGLHEFVYGLPELQRDALKGARRAAAAGCFATAMQLAVWPIAAAGLLDGSRPLAIFGVTGSSGSGAKPAPNTHHPHRAGNLWAYALKGHRHEAELRQALASTTARSAAIAFVPHSGPFVRGIHVTAQLPLRAGVDGAKATSIYATTYANEPFVEFLGDAAPDLRRVVGSNRASIGLAVRGATLTVCLTLDNIVKGGSGQALQCLNLMLGFDEATGLPRCGLGVTG
jgi:N-acetyl-gamma-glutamyl-phosphate reductase common form